MREGFSASALATAKRWRIPPESSWGKEFATPGSKPTANSSSVTRSRTSLLRRRRFTTRGSAMMDRPRRRGLKEHQGSWNTAWTEAR